MEQIAIEDYILNQAEEGTTPPEADMLPGFTNVHSLINNTLPPEQRAEVFQIAHALGLSKSDDLLFTLLVGLGYHKTMLCGVPDQITKTGADSARKIARAGDEAAHSVIVSATTAKGELTDSISQAKSEFLIAAQKGVQAGIENADLDKIFKQIASAAEKSGSKTWFSRALIFASTAILISIVVAGFSGWILKGIFTSAPISLEKIYFQQLTCGTVQPNGFFYCVDKWGGKVALKQGRESDAK